MAPGGHLDHAVLDFSEGKLILPKADRIRKADRTQHNDTMNACSCKSAAVINLFAAVFSLQPSAGRETA